MKKITVVIPAYNAHDTIEQTLSSIANQFKSNEIQVIIVNDKSKKGYEQIAKRYKHLLDIEIINMEENGGPGVARQKSLEACQTPYITFIDGDDIYLDGLFLDGVCGYLDTNPNCTNVNACFLEEKNDLHLKPHYDDITWVFGKVYRVDYLRKNNIGFSELRANEDMEFNLKIHLLQEPQEYTQFLNDKQVYLWKFKKDSITRVNDMEYSYHHGVIGGFKAKQQALDFSKKSKEKNDMVAFQEVPYLYTHFIHIIHDRPEKHDWLEAVFNEMVYFYHNYLKESWNELSKDEQAYFYNKTFKDHIMHVIPPITFGEFITKLEAKEL